MKTIILAEDDADDREFFEEALKEISIETTLTTVKDGAELMTVLDENLNEPPPPHVIFLDLNMPRKNGIECLKEIRANPKHQKIPVVIFSTSAYPDAVENSYSLGANCYIRKPNSHQLLKQTIVTVLSLKFWEHNQQLPKADFLLSIT